MPKPEVPLKPGTWTYKAKIEMGGQTMQMDVTTEITESPEGWLMSDTAKTPAGEITDRTVLDKTTLALRKRSVAQGPMKMELTVKDGKISGEMTVSGQPRPIAVDAGGDLFADGAGADHAIAALPLAPGFKTSFRNLNVQAMKPEVLQLQVAGSESVTVPAGTFDAFKVELSSDSGAKRTVWIAKDSRQVLKAIATSPQMGGAVVTSELQK